MITRLLGLLRAQVDDNLIEVGPGLGALTLPLLEQVAHLRVIEIDRDLIERLAARKLANLHIIEGDVLEIDWQQLHDGRPLRVVGNLPYNIGTPLLLKLLETHHLIKDIHVMLQKEVVDRLCASTSTKAFGRLSVLMQSTFEITPLFTVPATAFDPQPKVESAIVRLRSRCDAPAYGDIAALQIATRQAFANKRKTLRNNLKGHLDAAGFEALGIDPQARAETLDVITFIRLAKYLSSC